VRRSAAGAPSAPSGLGTFSIAMTQVHQQLILAIQALLTSAYICICTDACGILRALNRTACICLWTRTRIGW
jgi:hypothetical protein